MRVPLLGIYGVDVKDAIATGTNTMHAICQKRLSAVRPIFLAFCIPFMQLCIARLDTGAIAFDRRISSTDTVNNAIHIAALDPSGSVPSLFVCNNDRTIRVYNAQDMLLPVLSIACQVPMNYCTYSAERQLLACTGDSPAVSFYQASH